MSTRWKPACASGLETIASLRGAVLDPSGPRAPSAFNFYNRWIDATGVQDMPALGYRMSGHRLATQGYVQPAEESPAAGAGEEAEHLFPPARGGKSPAKSFE